MFDLPLHPKIVHLPIALAILMPLVSVGLLVAWWREWLPSRTWAVAVALQAILVTSAVVAMETGEDEEHQVEEVLASEQPLEEHEEAAEVFTYAAGATLGVMFLALFIPGDGRKKVIATVAAAGTVAVFYLGYQVGEAGGDLVYKHGAADAWTQPAAGGGQLRQAHDDDD